MDQARQQTWTRPSAADWAWGLLACACLAMVELGLGKSEMPWSRFSGWAWALVACSLALVAVGAWRLRRGDANVPATVEPRADCGNLPLCGALGLTSFALLYTYLYSLPNWLARSVQWLLALLGADNHGSFQSEQDAIRFTCGLAAQLLIVGSLLALNRALPGMLHTRPDAGDRELLSLDRRGLLRLAGLFATLVALQAVGNAAWSVFAGLAEQQGQAMPREIQPLVSQIANWHGPSWLLGVVFASVTIGAPLMEEVGFRGILYPALRESMPRGWAIAATGLLFGILHGNLAALIPISLMGAWLCVIRDRFGIGSCMVIHAMNNAWTVFWLITAPEAAGKL